MKQGNAANSQPIIVQGGKEQDTTKKIVTRGVWSDKEMILAAEAAKVEEEVKNRAFNKANVEGLVKVMSAMAMVPKDPLVWLLGIVLTMARRTG